MRCAHTRAKLRKIIEFPMIYKEKSDCCESFFLLTGDGICGRLCLCSIVRNTVVQKKEMKNVSVTYSMKNAMSYHNTIRKHPCSKGRIPSLLRGVRNRGVLRSGFGGILERLVLQRLETAVTNRGYGTGAFR